MERKIINSILSECQSAIDQFDDALESSAIEHLITERDMDILYETLNVAQTWVDRGYALRARDYVRKLYKHFDDVKFRVRKDCDFFDKFN